jgi:hypothetical protein
MGFLSFMTPAARVRAPALASTAATSPQETRSGALATLRSVDASVNQYLWPSSPSWRKAEDFLASRRQKRAAVA